MATFTAEDSTKTIGKLLGTVQELGYEVDSDMSDGISDYTHSFVRKDTKTKSILRFRDAGERIDVFHGVFILNTGSRTLTSWFIQSPQKLSTVLEKIA